MTDGYEPRFDIPPNFKADQAFGEEAERTVRDLLEMDGGIEVKHKRYEDWSFYVETAQSPLATGDYKASGINVTEAKLWAYEINGTGIVVFIPVERLKRAARIAPEKEERDGDNPTKGRLVSSKELFADPPDVEWSSNHGPNSGDRSGNHQARLTETSKM